MILTRQQRRVLASLGRRVRWHVVTVVLLCTIAILWVLLRPDMWTSCLVVGVVAIALALLGRDIR